MSTIQLLRELPKIIEELRAAVRRLRADVDTNTQDIATLAAEVAALQGVMGSVETRVEELRGYKHMTDLQLSEAHAVLDQLIETMEEVVDAGVNEELHARARSLLVRVRRNKGHANTAASNRGMDV